MTKSNRREFIALAGTVLTVPAFAIYPENMAIADEAGSTIHHVEIRKFRFSPEVLEVRPGDTIIWTNEDVVPHTATASDKSWDTGSLKKGESRSIVIDAGMTIDYFCRFHPHMKAKLMINVS